MDIESQIEEALDGAVERLAEEAKAEFGVLWDAIREWPMDGPNDPDRLAYPAWSELSEVHQELAAMLLLSGPLKTVYQAVGGVIRHTMECEES